MEPKCGCWAVIRKAEDIKWVPLNGAVEFYIGPLELTIPAEALAAFIAAATQAHRSQQERTRSHANKGGES